MFALERQKKILEILDAEGSVQVSKLSTVLDVTEETVRRDLEKLEKQEYLTRTHGGAIPIDESGYELSLEKRKHTNSETKEKLALEAVKHIVSGDTIFLDASTTTFFMAKELKKMKNVTVITNSIRIIDELAGCENIKLISVGGKVSTNQSFVGTISEDIIKEYFFASKVFFSSKGVTEDVGILESNEFECGIKQKMIENSSKRFYLCDKSKIGRVGFVKLCGFDKINTIITDAELDLSFKAKLDELKVDIIKI
jgi:DeoR/GlpR family transcriptional regulator of sugar metabolism